MLDFYTPATFAEKLGVSDIWVRELCRKGRIVPAKRVGGRWIIGRNAVVLMPPERMRQPIKLVPPEMTIRQRTDYLKEVLRRQDLADAGYRAW